MSKRRRVFILVAAAGLCAVLAASMVSRYVNRVEAQIGPLVEIVSARRDIPKGTTLIYANMSRYLALRRVAQRYSPQRAFTRIEQLLGFRSLVRISKGTYLSPGQLTSADAAPAPDIRRGERAVDLRISGVGGLSSTLGPGSRVDVVVTSEGRGGGGRSFLALEDVEVLAAAPAYAGEDTGNSGAAENAHMVVTLRVTMRQAVFLTAAQNFAKEVRVLTRAVGDHRRERTPPVGEGDLSS